MSYAVVVWHYLQVRWERERLRDDRGVITTEFAVLTFLVVAGAIAVVAILMTAARNNAENVPVVGG